MCIHIVPSNNLYFYNSLYSYGIGRLCGKGDKMIIDSKNAMWRGKLLSDYSKEELIEIVIQIHNMYNDNITEHKRQLEFLRSLRKRR
jgi:hypothetical protein